MAASINDLSCKMQVARNKCSCFSDRVKCLIIGYLHLIVSLVDIGIHLVALFVSTGGFQCDLDVDSFSTMTGPPYLKPILLIANLGTHGFYPFPLYLSSINYLYYVIELPSLNNDLKCYPGMLHVRTTEILNFLINVIWLRLVISFIVALHKKDPEQIRLFFGVSIVKLTLQVMYILFHPLHLRTDSIEAFWLLEILDICIITTFLVIINNYIRTLRVEKAQPVRDQPPPYVECLISTSKSLQTKTKPDLENEQQSQDAKKGDSPAILPI